MTIEIIEEQISAGGVKLARQNGTAEPEGEVPKTIFIVDSSEGNEVLFRDENVRVSRWGCRTPRGPALISKQAT